VSEEEAVALLALIWVMGALAMLCWAAYEIAESKSRSGVAWLLLAIPFGPLALAAVYMLPEGSFGGRPPSAWAPGETSPWQSASTHAQPPPPPQPYVPGRVLGDLADDTGLTRGEEFVRRLYDSGLSDVAVARELDRALAAGALTADDYASARRLHEST
jgi:hypothetical protein